MENFFSDLDVAVAALSMVAEEEPSEDLRYAEDLASRLDTRVELGRLDRSPKKNWVEDVGGLPAYIEEVAVSLHEKRGFTISRAIATAVSMIRKWARGGKDANPDTVAKAQAAIAQWEAKKLAAKAD